MMIKKEIVISLALSVAVTLVLPALAFAQTRAAVTINPNLPGINNVSTAGPCGWIVGFYLFAMIVAGILAFGSVVFGAFKYATSAGNPTKQSEGRSWIWSAVIGLLLLAIAYLILNTVNPNLDKCSLPTLTTAGIASTGSTATGGTPTGGGAGTGGTQPGSGVSGQTNGLQSQTVTDLNDAQQGCTAKAGSSCSVYVSSGVGGTHSVNGSCTHGNGCKADVLPNSSLNSYLLGLPVAAGGASTQATDWAAPGQLYQAPDGSIWANELVCPTRCGGNCGSGSSCWTGPHWDMAAHP